ncbi:MAG TPA: cation transporter, partial [Kineosporiaceae bacterium]|nr:cation transporter [Kineosporiaceae bacterium]
MTGPSVDEPRHVQDHPFVDLRIGGMTCSSCAARIEKKLNRMPGVVATVNYATEKARVSLPPDTPVEAAIATVVATGYTAIAAVDPPPPASVDESGTQPPGAREADARQVDQVDTAAALQEEETRALRQRLLLSGVLTAPVLALAMVSPLQFDNWQWLSLTLASPVVVWGAWPFHRAAWANLRHRAATMDTLISVGVLAAFGWSLYALFLGGAGMPDMRMPFRLLPRQGAGGQDIYLEVASAVTVFILAGRYLEARAKKQSGAALRALLAMGAKDVAVLRDGREVRVPV